MAFSKNSCKKEERQGKTQTKLLRINKVVSETQTSIAK